MDDKNSHEDLQNKSGTTLNSLLLYKAEEEFSQLYLKLHTHCKFVIPKVLEFSRTFEIFLDELSIQFSKSFLFISIKNKNIRNGKIF